MGAPDRRSEPDAAKREPASGWRARVPSKTELGSGGRASSLHVFRGLGQVSHCKGPYSAVLPSARPLSNFVQAVPPPRIPPPSP